MSDLLHNEDLVQLGFLDICRFELFNGDILPILVCDFVYLSVSAAAQLFALWKQTVVLLLC